MCQQGRALVGLVVTLFVTHTAAPAFAEKFFPADENGVEDYYTVLLDPAVSDAEAAAGQLGKKYGAQVTYVYGEVLHGFEASMDEEKAMAMSDDTAVRSVHQSSSIESSAALGSPVDHCYPPGLPTPTNTNQRPLPPIPPCGASMSCAQTLSCPQPGPDPEDDCIDNWGLDRIDQQGGFLEPDQEFNYRGAATSVSVFVLDVGIRGTNREFERAGTSMSRVTQGADVTEPCSQFCPPGNQDCVRGHGTHVAGIIGGRTFGVAKDVTLVPIRWLSTAVNSPPCPNYNGADLTNFSRGLDRIALVHPAAGPTAVLNISGGNASTWADVNNPQTLPVREAIISVASRENILIVQSAGNQGADACDHSFGDEEDYSGPDAAAIARIVVVAGFDPDLGQFEDVVLSGVDSNFGPCVDIWAPAADIVSAGGYVNDPIDNRVCRLTGTSMAAPQVSGVAAALLGEAPNTTSDQLKASLVEWATYNTLGLAAGHPIGPGSPNTRVRRAEDIVFEDGFNFDLSRWNTSVTANGGTLFICEEATMPRGSYQPNGEPNGLCVDLPGVANAAAYVVDQRPVAETSYYATYFADYGGLSMQPNDNHVILDATDTVGPVFLVRQRGDGFVRLHAFDDAGVVHFTPWIDHGIHAGSRPVVVSWQAGSPGLVTISASGGLPVESLSLQNGTRKIEQVALGAVGQVDASTTGVLRIDTFGSWTEGIRGLGGICHPAFETSCEACCNP